jgi:altronate hydrolase
MLIQRLHPDDDAIVALRTLRAGESVSLDGRSWTLRADIPAKHKFAARDFIAGDLVKMYGTVVGKARSAIACGELLSQGNVAHAVAPASVSCTGFHWTPPDVSRWAGRTFDGYRRADGRCATSNLWLVVPLVFCENRNIEVMREALTKGLGYDVTTPYADFVGKLAGAWRGGASLDEIHLHGGDAATRVFPHVDGVKFLQHTLGCGGTRQDARALCGLLAGYITHPNVAGATVLSLGCQNAEVKTLMEELAKRSPGPAKPLLVFEQQKSTSERDLMERALRETFRGIAAANELRREPVPLNELVLGLKCGGSDGFSGISANPALGHCADLLAALGGSTVLCEFPELCGAEQWLCDRCETPALADRFLDLMRRYAATAQAVGSGFDMNPSPGNIRDGLITDAMKSLGAARKGGSAPVVDVLDYPELVTKRGGLTLLCTPGNDVEATTALTGSGCNVIVFTTGLGTPTGNPVCPVIKMATNTDIATRMADIIDFDAGGIVGGAKTIPDTGAELLDHIIEVASGRAIPAAVRLGQDDFIPWKRGVSL